MSYTEAQLQRQIFDLARDTGGWHVMHVRRTIGKGRRWTTGTSVVGWPDLTIWGHGRFLMAELKADDGELSDDQAIVIASLRDAGVDVRVWRPSDWPEIEALFMAPRVEAQQRSLQR